MLIILSPAKTLAEGPALACAGYTQPEMLDAAEKLIERLRRVSPAQLKELMGISDKLVELNRQRYADFAAPFRADNARQAIYMFRGDVYEGLQADTLGLDDLAHAQTHLRILSGLYGVLRPLDLMQPYRLEMGTRLTVARKPNLYGFWDDRITAKLNQDLAAQGDDVLVNLASNEYFKSVKPKSLQARIVTPGFREERDGQFKMISFFAKKARGLMARYIIAGRLTTAAELEGFDLEGYRFNRALSKPDAPMFTRAA